MPNPKRKHTRSRRDLRRSANSKLEAINVVPCANCGEMRLPHNICPKCGFYDGKPVVEVKAKKTEAETAK